MTFCVGIQVKEGIVALADTRIVRGSEQLNKNKLAPLDHSDDALFTMTSGLRSVRDKTLTYLSEELEKKNQPYDRLYKLVNEFSTQLRKVKTEDEPSLTASNYRFNMHAVICGCMTGDHYPKMYYVYPEGNWIESATDSPYFMLGRTTYGKPILDRLLNFQTPLRVAVGLALLAFDATSTSVTDVDCPIDIAIIPWSTRKMSIRRYTQQDVTPATTWWSETLSSSLSSMPLDWSDGLFSDADNTNHQTQK
jgi:putative proteasome-type protease